MTKKSINNPGIFITGLNKNEEGYKFGKSKFKLHPGITGFFERNIGAKESPLFGIIKNQFIDDIDLFSMYDVSLTNYYIYCWSWCSTREIDDITSDNFKRFYKFKEFLNKLDNEVSIKHISYRKCDDVMILIRNIDRGDVFVLRYMFNELKKFINKYKDYLNIYVMFQTDKYEVIKHVDTLVQLPTLSRMDKFKSYDEFISYYDDDENICLEDILKKLGKMYDVEV